MSKFSLYRLSSCCICGEVIGSDDYGFSTTKSVTRNGKTFKSHQLLFHLKCYNKLLPKNHKK